MIRLAVTTLLTVPNISEGRDHAVIDAIARAFGLPRAEHPFAIPTITARCSRSPARPASSPPRSLAAAHMATATLDISAHDGIHPRIGALDVAPIVYLDEADRGAACAEALVLGRPPRRGARAAGVPVRDPRATGRTRAELRRGGPDAARKPGSKSGELTPDFGPRTAAPDRRRGARRRPPAADRLQRRAQGRRRRSRTPSAIAALIREGGADGLRGVRAIGLWLEHRGVAQVSTNVEDHRPRPLGRLVARSRSTPADSSASSSASRPRRRSTASRADLVVRNQRSYRGRSCG